MHKEMFDTWRVPWIEYCHEDESVIQQFMASFQNPRQSVFELHVFMTPGKGCCHEDCDARNLCDTCGKRKEYLDNFKDLSEFMLLFIMDKREGKIWDLEKKEWVPIGEYSG